MGAVMTAASTNLWVLIVTSLLQGNPQAMQLSFTTAKHMSLNIAYFMNYFVRNMAWS